MAAPPVPSSAAIFSLKTFVTEPIAALNASAWLAPVPSTAAANVSTTVIIFLLVFSTFRASASYATFSAPDIAAALKASKVSGLNPLAISPAVNPRALATLV